MPNRIIKESICSSEEIDRLNDAAECFFYRLIVNCDDYGLMDARPAILKARCYPLKSVDINRIHAMLSDLERAGLISLYAVHDRPYLRVISWEKHQQVRAKRAKFPVPADGAPITCAQLISDASNSPRNPIQSNPNKTSLSGDGPPAVDNSPAIDGPTLVPEDFQPADDIKARLFRAGRTDVDPHNPILIATFISHHQGAGTCSPDWDAKFLNWCLRERKGVPHETANPNGGGSRTRGQRVHEKLKDIARRDLEARAAAGGSGGGDGEVLGALPAQVGQRNRRP